jgi:hypothetical protein
MSGEAALSVTHAAHDCVAPLLLRRGGPAVAKRPTRVTLIGPALSGPASALP